MSNLNFAITDDLKAKIEKEAKRLALSRADFVRLRLYEYFDAQKNSSELPGLEKESIRVKGIRLAKAKKGSK